MLTNYIKQLAFYQQMMHIVCMNAGQAIFDAIFSVNSVWSVVARGALWFVIAGVIIVSTDSPNPNKSLKSLKTNLGFLMMFLVLGSGLMYLLFGMSPAT